MDEDRMMIRKFEWKSIPSRCSVHQICMVEGHTLYARRVRGHGREYIAGIDGWVHLNGNETLESIKEAIVRIFQERYPPQHCYHLNRKVIERRGTTEHWECPDCGGFWITDSS